MGKKSQSNDLFPDGYRFLKDIMPDLSFVTSKIKSAKAYYTYFLNRCLQMFSYKNLPESIPQEILDKYLMVNGIACITTGPENDDSQLRVFYGNLGGEQDCYYRPTKFIIANPHFKTTFSKECVVLGDSEPHDGVLMRNDKAWLGLHPMLSRYSCLMAENVVTIRVADIMLRITALLSAPSDKEYTSAMQYLKALAEGDLGVIAENPFFEGIKMQSPPSNNGSYLTQFIELQQYFKGSFYNEIGLSANYNMKREAIGKGESTLDEDALLPLSENMLNARREDFAKVNEMFDTNISVDFSSAWLENMIESKLILLNTAKEAGLTSTSSTSTPEKGGNANEEVSQSGENASATPGSASATSGANAPSTNSPTSSTKENSSEESVSQLTANEEELGQDESSGDNSGQVGDNSGQVGDNSGQDDALEEMLEVIDEAISQLTVKDESEVINDELERGIDGDFEAHSISEDKGDISED